MGVTFSQFFPPAATLTEETLPSQTGKVFIVTGATSGVGLELATLLYQAGAKVYVTARSEASAKQAIETIKSLIHASPNTGQLEYLLLQLDDLSSIKPAVESFRSKESKLDVLWNNAAVSLPPLGSKSVQGHELQIATNCLGPFLLTQLLLPSLEAVSPAQKSDGLSTAPRVVWTSTQMVDLTNPLHEDTIMADIANPPADQTRNYLISKIGNWFLASELARRSPSVLSVTQNPGNLNTNLLRHAKWMKFAAYPLLHKAKKGAYTELWAGLSPDLTLENSGSYIIPWGRLHPAPRKELLGAFESVEEGGTGLAKEFWEWCDKQTREFR